MGESRLAGHPLAAYHHPNRLRELSKVRVIRSNKRFWSLKMNAAANGLKPPVLTCWKDIANYMGKGVRTVQRWELEFGLPVRRPLGSNKKAVLARPSDLDAWVALRCGARTPLPAAPNGKRQAPAVRLAALTAQLETAHQLRDNNRVLLDEFRFALSSLQQQILSLRDRQPAAP